MKHTFFALSLVLSSLLSIAHAAPPSPAHADAEPVAGEASGIQRPNIILLLTDDQRHDTLSCAGHPVIQTPHIDKLASRGARFTNAFVTTSICAASRASILTGLVESTHGFTFGKPPVPARFIDDSYPVKLREAGYRTGFYGKFGVSVEGGRPTIDRMFDDFADLTQPFLRKLPDGSVRHVDDLITDRALAFIRDNPADRPFCLSLSFNGGHAADGQIDNLYPCAPEEANLYADVKIPRLKLDDPAIFEAMPEFLRKSMGRERWFWGSDTPEKYDHNMRNYLRMISTIDRNVGRILAELEARGIADNTVIIYTADNGYLMGERGLTGKWIHFESSLRVPLIVLDPRLPASSAGRLPDAMALNIDVAPTMLDLAGVAIPARYHGRSLLPILRGTPAGEPRTAFFCEHRMDNKTIPKWEGLRTARHVYANYYEQDPPYEFLHDLEKDPDQLTNFAADPAYADVLATMREKTKQLSARYAADAKPQAADPSGGGGKPRILLLGDSISMGYHPFVVAMLKDDAVVVRPKENCEGTTKGAASIDNWLKLDGGSFDFIHFNFGLHDLKHVAKPGDSKAVDDPDAPYQATVEQYEKNLRAIVAKLKATGATLIFATTTPVPPGRVNPHRDNADVIRYNEAALRVMKEHGIAIDDLYAFALPRLKDIQQPANVHFTKDGSRALAEEVAKHLRDAITAK